MPHCYVQAFNGIGGILCPGSINGFTHKQISCKTTIYIVYFISCGAFISSLANTKIINLDF